VTGLTNDKILPTASALRAKRTRDVSAANLSAPNSNGDNWVAQVRIPVDWREENIAVTGISLKDQLDAQVHPRRLG